FAIFSPTVFYIKEIPCRIIPHEALIIFLFGLLSAALSSWFASGRVTRIRPAEVLRYESRDFSERGTCSENLYVGNGTVGNS
ncbi:MAG: hypothetical protein LBV20_07620, partial [Treponema sp.]|nr:hypothetical protein [Treponema sp.]